MAQKENMHMGDIPNIEMSPSKKVGGKEYGAVLSANESTMMDVAKMAIDLKRMTGKPIMIILSDGGGNGT